MQRLDSQRDTLTAADTKGDQTARQAVSAHRVDQLGRQHGTSRADRMTMGYGTALDVDDILRQPELARHHDSDGREGFIDLSALNRTNVQPARCSACLTAG